MDQAKDKAALNALAELLARRAVDGWLAERLAAENPSDNDTEPPQTDARN